MMMALVIGAMIGAVLVLGVRVRQINARLVTLEQKADTEGRMMFDWNLSLARRIEEVGARVRAVEEL